MAGFRVGRSSETARVREKRSIEIESQRYSGSRTRAEWMLAPASPDPGVNELPWFNFTGIYVFPKPWIDATYGALLFNLHGEREPVPHF